MRSQWLATLAVVLVVPLCACPAAAGKHKVVEISADVDAAPGKEQVLLLSGLKMSPGTMGVNVFLNPIGKDPLNENSESFLGAVYSSHRNPGEPKATNYVLSLPKPVSGRARIVIQALPAEEKAGGWVEIKAAKIVDSNSLQSKNR